MLWFCRLRYISVSGILPNFLLRRFLEAQWLHLPRLMVSISFLFLNPCLPPSRLPDFRTVQLTLLIGKKFDKLKTDLSAKLAEIKNEWLKAEARKQTIQSQIIQLDIQKRSFQSELEKIKKEQRTLLYYCLRYRKEAGLLRERDIAIFSRELKNINRLNQLEKEAAALTVINTKLSSAESPVIVESAVNSLSFDSPTG